jgi:hypothetical protein
MIAPSCVSPTKDSSAAASHTATASRRGELAIIDSCSFCGRERERERRVLGEFLGFG